MKTKRNKAPSTTPVPPVPPVPPVTPPVTPPVPPVTPPEPPESIPVPPIPTATVAGILLPFSSDDAKACARYYSLAMTTKGATILDRINTYRAAVDARPAKVPSVREAVFSAMKGLSREQWGTIIAAEGATAGVSLPPENPPAADNPPKGRTTIKVRPVRDGTFYGTTLTRGGDVVRVRATPNETKDGTAVSSFSCVIVDSAGTELTAEDHTGKRVPLMVRVESRPFIYPDTREAAESLATELAAAISFASQPADPATLTAGETVRVWDYGGGTSTPFATAHDWRWEGNHVHNGTTVPYVVSREGSFVQWESPAYLTRVPSGLSPLATFTYHQTRDAIESLARTMYAAGLDDATVASAIRAIKGNVVSAYPTTPVEGADNATTGGEGKAE